MAEILETLLNVLLMRCVYIHILLCAVFVPRLHGDGMLAPHECVLFQHSFAYGIRIFANGIRCFCSLSYWVQREQFRYFLQRIYQRHLSVTELSSLLKDSTPFFTDHIQSVIYHQNKNLFTGFEPFYRLSTGLFKDYTESFTVYQTPFYRLSTSLFIDIHHVPRKQPETRSWRFTALDSSDRIQREYGTFSCPQWSALPEKASERAACLHWHWGQYVPPVTRSRAGLRSHGLWAHNNAFRPQDSHH